MRILPTLARTAAGVKHAYVIVFTGLLLYELLRFRIKRNRYAENRDFNPGRPRY